MVRWSMEFDLVIGSLRNNNSILFLTLHCCSYVQFTHYREEYRSHKLFATN